MALAFGRDFFGQKRAYYAVLAHFWQFLVSSSNLVTFVSNLSNFEKKSYKPKKSKTFKKFQKKKKIIIVENGQKIRNLEIYQKITSRSRKLILKADLK